MYQRIISFVSVAAFLFIVAACQKGAGDAQKGAQKALVKVSTGAVQVVRGGQTSPLNKGDALAEGDSIKTGGDGLAIIALYGGRGEVEIQENAVFRLTSLAAAGKLNQEKGNAWIRMTKLQKNESLQVVTPTAIAGVRGTKFYNFTLQDGTSGICQCEGSIDYNEEASGFSRVHEEDTVVLNRGKTTVVLTQADLAPLGMGDHHHSTVPNSSLGPQNKMTPEQGARMIALINQKFAEAGAN